MMQKQRYKQNASNLEEQKQLFTWREELQETDCLGETKQGCHLGEKFNGIKQFPYLTGTMQSAIQEETAHKQNSFACSLVGTTLTEAEHILWGAEHCQHPMGTEVTPGAAVLELFPFFPSLPGEALSPVGRDAVSLLKLSLTKTSSLSQFRPWKCCGFFFLFLKTQSWGT